MTEVKYIHTTEAHNTRAANAFIPVLFKLMPPPASVIDIGCGLGTWLKVFQDNGTKEIIGIDGSNVDRKQLAIPEEAFIAHDLRLPLQLQRKFDLALCLEVAEHLPVEDADNIIDILVAHSDNILFSAALPLQGGQNHINEQPIQYWVKKFNDRGFIVKDIFRNVIWNNKEIDWWYRQNLMFATKSQGEEQADIKDYHHPESIVDKKKGLEEIIRNADNRTMNLIAGKMPVGQAFKIFVKSIARMFGGKN